MGQAKNRGSREQRQQAAEPKQAREQVSVGGLSMRQATSILLKAGRSAKRR